MFAIVATLANIGSQEVVARLHQGPRELWASLLVGTVVGLTVKYVLDKKYIFGVTARNVVDDSRMFLLYSLMGVVTTLVFWGFEFSFDLVFDNRPMRYVGGVIGLAIGYALKYRLDRRYVFPAGARAAGA
jgi:putative flippase GtrA